MMLCGVLTLILSWASLGAELAAAVVSCLACHLLQVHLFVLKHVNQIHSTAAVNRYLRASVGSMRNRGNGPEEMENRSLDNEEKVSLVKRARSQPRCHGSVLIKSTVLIIALHASHVASCAVSVWIKDFWERGRFSVSSFGNGL